MRVLGENDQMSNSVQNAIALREISVKLSLAPSKSKIFFAQN